MNLLFLYLLFCLVFVTLEGHQHPGIGKLPTEDCNSKEAIEWQSYHIHILFWQNNNASIAAIDTLVASVLTEYDLDEEKTCLFQPGEPMPRAKMCFFGTEPYPAGPFVTGQSAFFIPKDQIAEVTQFVVTRRGGLDVLVHPNSLCPLLDHVEWGMWAGSKWEVDTSIFLD